MKTQSALMEMMVGQISTSAKSSKKEDTSTADYPKFNSFLKDSINKRDTKPAVSTRDEKSVNSYRQLPKNRIMNVSKKETDTSIRTEDKPAEKLENEDSSTVKEKAVIKGTAELLGITPEELTAALASLNIKPSELADPTTCTQVVAKLSEVLGLNSQQQTSLDAAVKEITAMVDGLMEQAVKNTAVGKEEWVKVEGVKIDVINNQKPDYSEMTKMLDSKVHEMVGALKENGELSLNDIALKMKQMMADIQLQKSIQKAMQNDSPATQADASEGEKEDRNDHTSSQDSSTQTIGNLKKPEADGGKIQAAAPQAEDNLAIVSTNAAEPAKNVESVKAARITSEVRTVRNEIMSQVVEKAKVLLDGNKSEMIMELRPESLGKLALKVVTENGIVMAKFVAENQQVKETLEANMQLLKDTLEKQGLSIQGLNVSVGQDSNGGYDPRRNFNGESNRGPERFDSEEGDVAGILVDRQAAMENPYGTSDSHFDSRA